tara:strand:- start:44 stop:739 length:696 start_codon:yes stop_codon:yes gene_type:complete
MWACYEFTIPKPKSFPANYTQKRLQPQIADKVTALQRIIDIQTGGWDLESAVSLSSRAQTSPGWKPLIIARSGQYGSVLDINPFKLYHYETFGFTTLLAKMLGGVGSWSIYFEPDDGIDKKDETQIKKDYISVSKFARTESRLINFATYAGAKMFCEEDDSATTCEIDNTHSIARRLNRKDGKLYYPYGARYGSKIIVSTWVNESGDLSVRWAESYPIYSDPAAFNLVASG